MRIVSTFRAASGGRVRSRHLAWFAAILAAIVLSLPLVTSDAAAKPKKASTVNGCTAEQIQAPSSGACINQLEQDTVAGVAYPHQLFCDASGVYCCQSDGTRTFGCKKVSALVRPPNLSPIAPGTLQNAPP